MSLVPCRACQHHVDCSALACPKCGATDPAKKISRQQRDLISFLVQFVIWFCIVGYAGLYAWNTLIPIAKQYIVKPQTEHPPTTPE